MTNLLSNPSNLNFGKMLTVACTSQVILAALELHYTHLIVTTLANDFARYLSTLNIGRTNRHIITLSNDQHPFEFNVVTRITVKPLKADQLSFGNSVLLPTALENRKHHDTPDSALLYNRNREAYSLTQPASSGDPKLSVAPGKKARNSTNIGPFLQC
jgi:hypothetical protein